MKILSLILFSLFLATAVHAQAPGAARDGQRPPDSIFDPTGILTAAQKEEISAPLRKILADEGIDVLVVIVPEIGDAPPNHVARGYAEKWGYGTIHSVVLHVPGHGDAPWIFPGEAVSRSIRPEIIRETISAAEMRAASEPSDFGKVRAASIEAADTLRYWMGSALLRSEQRITEGLRQRLAYEKGQRLLKLAAFLGLALVIPVFLGLVFLVIGMRSRRPKHFPAVRKIQRLGAPHAGGNHAVVQLD